MDKNRARSEWLNKWLSESLKVASQETSLLEAHATHVRLDAAWRWLVELKTLALCNLSKTTCFSNFFSIRHRAAFID